jgi:hypothetical protein
VDDETAPIVTFNTSSYTLSESTAFQVISVTMRVNAIPEDPDQEISVEVSTRNGSARAGLDYVPINNEVLSFGTLDFTTPFTSIVVSKLITVEILEDIRLETPETLNLILSNATGARIGALNETTITILDTPPRGVMRLPFVGGRLPTFQFDQSSYVVDEDIGTATISVTVSHPVIWIPATVQYVTVAGTASETSDYIFSSGVLTFELNAQQPQTITLPIVNDQIAESTEGLFVVLQNVTGGAELNPATAFLAVVILDDDSAAHIQSTPQDIRHHRLDIRPWKMGIPLVLGVSLLWWARTLVYARRRR